MLGEYISTVGPIHTYSAVFIGQQAFTIEQYLIQY